MSSPAPPATLLPAPTCRFCCHCTGTIVYLYCRTAAGDVEYVFVMEDKADPAHGVVAALAADQNRRHDGRPVRIVAAGQAARTSQKIHK